MSSEKLPASQSQLDGLADRLDSLRSQHRSYAIFAGVLIVIFFVSMGWNIYEGRAPGWMNIIFATLLCAETVYGLYRMEELESFSKALRLPLVGIETHAAEDINAINDLLYSINVFQDNVVIYSFSSIWWLVLGIDFTAKIATAASQIHLAGFLVYTIACAWLCYANLRKAKKNTTSFLAVMAATKRLGLTK